MESRGNKKLFSGNTNVGCEQVGTALHFGPRPGVQDSVTSQKNSLSNLGYNTAFHNYQLEWSPEKITFRVDNQINGEFVPTEGGFWEQGGFANRSNAGENPWGSNTKMAPFDQEFYLLINLAVGGNNGYFSDDFVNLNAKKPWSNQSPQHFKDFWEARKDWLPTWHLSQFTPFDSSFVIDHVRVWAL